MIRRLEQLTSAIEYQRLEQGRRPMEERAPAIPRLARLSLKESAGRHSPSPALIGSAEPCQETDYAGVDFFICTGIPA